MTELYNLLNNIEECIKVWTSILNMCIKVLATLTVDIAIAIGIENIFMIFFSKTT